ncbi:hypothetical protein CBR_g23352 [Chara braunii]|uniref:LRAT domain-containing protein n=1 Tax=Chara braunii TaxID=69332 RepID=A0A388L3Z5_CHABU|nr:hypothetical protein CBR_g23352 [Chara braunii]|eukprot:GBG77026.1 hypothetical protein CBR_g23352 [Chara braunii]
MTTVAQAIDATWRLWSNRVSKADLVPGDHIYSWRKGYMYAHHGIYAGDGRVLHFTNGKEEVAFRGAWSFLRGISSKPPVSDHEPCAACNAAFRSRIEGGNGVIETCLLCFLDGRNLYRFKYGVKPLTFLAKVRGGTCTMATTDNPAEVLERARYLLEHGFGDYDVFSNNCEDFAIYCKTGLLMTKSELGRSSQAASAGLIPASALMSASGRLLTANPLGAVAVAVGLYLWGRYTVDVGVRDDVIRVDAEELVTHLRRGRGRPFGMDRTEGGLSHSLRMGTHRTEALIDYLLREQDKLLNGSRMGGRQEGQSVCAEGSPATSWSSATSKRANRI